MPSLPGTGTSAWVEVDGVRAEEYAVQTPDSKSAKCFIESVEGLKFAIGWRTEEQEVHLTFFVDGEKQATRHTKSLGVERHSRGRQIDSDHLRPFLFTKIALTDDEDLACSTEALIKGLGTITVEMRRAITIGTKAGAAQIYSDPLQRIYSDPLQRTYHEQLKKAQMHTAGFGKVEQTKARSGMRQLNYTDERDQPPWCTYTFYYRDKTYLELQGHKPPSTPAREEEAPIEPEAGPSHANERIPLATQPPPLRSPPLSNSPPQAGPSRIIKQASPGEPAPARTDSQQRIRELEEEVQRVRRIGELEDELDRLRNKHPRVEVKAEEEVKKKTPSKKSLSKSKEVILLSDSE